jgi:SSS family solute:Na+ symporter
MDAIRDSVGPEYLSLTNIKPVTFINWFITIVPIWFVGMTLYQRIYACKDVKTAKRAWYIAGLFEYPIMAFMGVILGLFAKVAADQGMFASLGYASADTMDAEMGLPLLLRTILPSGLMGLMLSAYFSAIMSTADSCLMAASGNINTDVLGRLFPTMKNTNSIGVSQIITLFIGVLAIFLATIMQNVLELMLLSYAFMVSGLFVPVIGALFWKKGSPSGAFWAMIGGGFTTVFITINQIALPFGLDANIGGIAVSAALFLSISLANVQPQQKPV